ncbi:zinc finger protein 714-like [Aedes aegypti]|uniref:C2H2-type domain-containing protein n=1 Tax=Aedes aegypti TaxID=7159 RepID=A0A6I8U4G4_AEDAE|nr:zinc finger protein 714-like [Aedes aegypti]
MNSLVKLNQYKNSTPIVDLFASQSNLVQTVIKDLDLCRKDSFSVEDLLEEFPRYDMAFSEDGVLKQEIPNQDQGESFAEELPNLPIDTGTIYAEECTIEELQELTKDNPDLLVTDSSDDYPVFKKNKPPIKSKYGGRKLDKPLQCPKCPYSTYFKRNFHTHQEVHKKRETRVYACKEPGCTEVFKTYRKYKRHGHQTFICDNCGLRCASKASLKGHLARHAMKLEHKCPYCRQGYNTKEDLRLHVRHQHLGTISYSCEICEMSFNRKSIRDGHLLTHGKSLDFPCTMCDKKFKTHKYLQKHINGVHKKLQFTCSYCNADFRTTYLRNNHIECVHGIQTRFVCGVCVQTFDSQDKLDSHRARHENPHDQECGKCLAVFTSKDLLGSHQCITYR